ncbi:hypothetical protein EI982_08640 [Haloplanus rallus]|uniref:DOD-type homing endonuclease domain-containing protein n=1 Tax=Haloplanus rallus TaxID=1816183 RepID=A0A6B9F9D3_9EURY|nr:hypothetical protein [Haloplanus rallus]QGX94851.1 hypothetical protein EI982_08640 [Haloplanus rallus]
MASKFVTEQEFAETYTDDGWETVTQYREATRLRDQNPEMARAEIARRVDRPQSAIRGWLAEGKTPAVISGLRTAKEHGWIDVDTDSERFRALNQLVAWIFSGGGISVDTFTPHFSADDSMMLAILAQHFRWLHLGYRCRHLEDSDRHLEIVPTEGSAIFGRVLSVLGAPRGVKAQRDDLTLPPYLSTVDNEHRRDFARIYLLNRNTNPEQTGSYIQGIHSETFAEELCELFTTAALGSATIGSQHRVWVSAATVRDLSESNGGTTTGEERVDASIRSGLATTALYGSSTPPTERAIASTFRRTKTPGGYRYHRCYEAARNRDDSRSSLAAELGVPESSIQSWRRGSRPYATNALERARERGWCDVPPESETATALTALLTWLLARGSLRETYYPVFGADTTAQRERFASLADVLGLSYEIVRPGDPDWPTELRLNEEGALLGRILYALGVPRLSESQMTAQIPLLAYHYRCHAQQVAEIWRLHHAEPFEDEGNSGNEGRSMKIAVPPSVGEQFSNALVQLLSTQLGWTIDQSAPRDLIVIDGPSDWIV